jgi:hypothetical protein
MRQSIQGLIDLTKVSAEDCQTLRNVAGQTEQWADQFVKMFYDTLFDYHPTRVLFREGERPARETTIRDWYLQVVRGEIGDDFWSAQWQVGRHHIDRNIPNSYMLAMMHRTQAFFVHKCAATFGPEEALKISDAFKKVTDVAAGIIVEGYLTTWRIR